MDRQLRPSEANPSQSKTKQRRREKKKPLGIHRNGKKRVKRKQTKKDNRITSAWSSVPAVFFSPHSSRLRDKANSVIFKHSAAKRYERDTLLSGGDDGSGTTLVDDHGTEKEKETKRNESQKRRERDLVSRQSPVLLPRLVTRWEQLWRGPSSSPTTAALRAQRRLASFINWPGFEFIRCRARGSTGGEPFPPY